MDQTRRYLFLLPVSFKLASWLFFHRYCISEQLNLGVADVASAVEALCHLFLESSRLELTDSELKESVVPFGLGTGEQDILVQAWLRCWATN